MTDIPHASSRLQFTAFFDGTSKYEDVAGRRCGIVAHHPAVDRYVEESLTRPALPSWTEGHVGRGGLPIARLARKRSAHPVSVDALLTRLGKDVRLPTINAVVDLYNAISGPVAEAVPAGEVVWTDDRGVTCRRWNWRQGTRTRVDLQTRRAWFVLERLEPMPLAAGGRVEGNRGLHYGRPSSAVDWP